MKIVENNGACIFWTHNAQPEISTMTTHFVREDRWIKGTSGRRKISWLRNLRQWTSRTSMELFRAAANKVKSSIVIANIH